MEGHTLLTSAEVNLQFKRNDLHTVGSVNRGCMSVLPQGKKARQKIAVGDGAGAVSVFGVGKTHDVKVDFTSEKNPKATTRLELFTDQIFGAFGERVAAYTKKGRVFFVLDTNVSEPIQHLRVSTPYLYTCGEYALTGFKESEERTFFMVPDKVNDILIDAKDDAGNIDVILACQDRALRTVRGGQIAQQMGCEGPLNALHFLAQKNTSDAKSLIYGTVNGSLSGLSLSNNGLVRKFTATPDHRVGSITSIASADLTRDGFPDVVLSRDDGCVEIHSFEANPDGTPVAVWKGEVNEFITAADTGFVTNIEREECVVSTFSGKVLSFSYHTDDTVDTQTLVPQMLEAAQAPLQQPTAPSAVSTALSDSLPAATIVRGKIQETSGDITVLQQQLDRKKQEYAQASGLVSNDAPVSRNHNLRAVTTAFSVREKMFLDDTGALHIAVELDTQLDSVSLSSNVALQLVDSVTESNVSCVTPSGLAPQSTSKMLATFRSNDAASTRLEILVRPSEGVYGEVIAFITAKVQPKTTQLKRFFIPPLSLHRRVPAGVLVVPDFTNHPATSSIQISGGFSVKDAHLWMYRAMFEVPEHFTSGEEGTLTLKNIFTDTHLHVVYRKGDISLFSDNITTLAIAKEFVTAQATQRKLQVGMNTSIKPETVVKMVDHLYDKVKQQSQLQRHANLAEALRELEVQEQDIGFLTAEYKEVLASASSLEKNRGAQEKILAQLTHTLVRLLHDKAAFNGLTPAPGLLRDLEARLVSLSRDELIEIFQR